MEHAFTKTERTALSASPFEAFYPPTEKIPAIVVEHFPALGKLTAMRFIEWVQANPGGVVSLPTGKTPEHFIHWVTRILGEWDVPEIRTELEKSGVDPSVRPDMQSLHFVQIDEFYPISSSQQNSFHHYVNRFYIEGFGLDPDKALLIDSSAIGLCAGESLEDVWPGYRVDLSLRYRRAKTRLEEKQKRVLAEVDAWCMDYEERITALGGIGFFLGGIGPDGHIGFNIRGSDHHSTTRLCPINYETQAAAASDLGGIEVSRNCLVITIGLRTITHNPDAAAIVMVAGEAKAGIVARAVQAEPGDIAAPAAALQALPNARFYLTRGAAVRLDARRLHAVETAETVPDAVVERTLIDLAVARKKRLVDLEPSDHSGPDIIDRVSSAVLAKRSESLADLARMVHESLESKIQRGTASIEGKTYLHTEPHHDDIMLGYFAHVVRHFRHPGNTHFFLTLTSGFTSVTNRFMEAEVENLKRFIDTPEFRALMDEGYFDADNAMGRNRDVWQYLDGVAARDEDMKAEGCARRFLRDLIEVFEESRLENLEDRIQELDHYFETQYPGKRDLDYIQRLKGMAREWEAECLWAYYGSKAENVMALRLGFYTGSIFTDEPTRERDVPPIVEALEKADPDVVTVALDPEASGPDTHYKVLQAMAAALEVHARQAKRSDIRVWGYRNVWYRFNPSEADVFVPVSLCMFSIVQEAFHNAFLSQKDASFPSHEHDGPFSELAQRIQVEQYQTVKTCLGRQWFQENPSPLIRATRGLVFLRDMSLDDFHDSCRELRQSVENLE